MSARLALLLAVVAAAAAPARAEEPPQDETGLVLGLRAGYGVPFGTLSQDALGLREVVRAKVPLWLELGYRFNARVQGTVFFELAPAEVADARCADGSCTASDARFGVEVQVHLAPRARLDPWLGAGFGIEVLRAETTDPDPLAPAGRSDWTWAGVELPLLEAGVDVRVSPRFTLGPYLSVSLGQFTSAAERPPGGSTTSGAIEDRETHGWVQGGLKATLRL